MTWDSREYTALEWNNIQSEFKRIDEYYVDHAGTTLYSENLIKNSTDRLSKNLYCNPHTSKATGDLIDQVRYKILKHFNSTSSQYHVVFVSGTTTALKLVGECFDFGNENGNFVYVKDNHTSVLGMREVVRTKNISFIEKDKLLNEMNMKNINGHRTDEPDCSNSLLTLSAQCNYNGYKIPLNIINHVKENGLSIAANSKWYTCLDAASYVSTNFLDLSKWNPDFVCLSFYKMFGYPTGIGALLVRKSCEHLLQKRYYGGGTVKIAMSELNWHRKREVFHERFEDGTVAFLSIISLLSGFETIDRLVPPNSEKNSMERISNHTFQLAKYFYNEMKHLKYNNGNPVIKFYTDTEYESKEYQGGIVNFNVLHDDGTYIGFAEIAYMANIHKIYLRTGCFCNPGACQRLLNLSNEDIKNQYNAGHICGDTNDLVDGVPTGSVRVSVGYMTGKKDVDAVLEMIKNCYVVRKNSPKLPSDYRYFRKKPMEPILNAIYVFPIKSCGPAKITTEWKLSAKGLLYDREWMIVNYDGLAITQKHSTIMCLIQPAFDFNTNELILSFPDLNSIRIPIETDSKQRLVNGIVCQTKVCGDNVQGYDCGDEIADWISTALQMSGLRLIRQNNDDRISNYSKNTISLSNQAQFLLINSTSVKWLAEKVEDWIADGIFPKNQLESVVDRFRGNLIIETATPLEESKWNIIKIGDVEFKAEGPCTRCQMICIDQNSGIKTTEPLKTIAREFKGKMNFGVYLTRVNNDSTILKCGNNFTVIQK